MSRGMGSGKGMNIFWGIRRYEFRGSDCHEGASKWISNAIFVATVM